MLGLPYFAHPSASAAALSAVSPRCVQWQASVCLDVSADLLIWFFHTLYTHVEQRILLCVSGCKFLLRMCIAICSCSFVLGSITSILVYCHWFGRIIWACIFSKTSTLPLGPTQPFLQWIPDSSPGFKRRNLEVDRSPPSSGEVKNERRWTYIHPTLLHGLERVTFYVTRFRFLNYAFLGGPRLKSL